MNASDDAPTASGDVRSQVSGGPPPFPVEVMAEPPWQRRHPVVLDTTVLIADALKRSDTTFTALTYLAQRNVITMVAPRHVEEEVFRKLPKAALDTRRDPSRVLATLESVHLPFVRFIDLPAALPEEVGVRTVAQRDDSDAPLAHLATLLSPCLVLSTDKDLTDSGYGNDGWLADVLLLGELAQLDNIVWGGGMLAYVSVAVPAYGVWKLIAFLARSKLGLGIAAAAAIGGAVWFRPQLRAAADRAGTHIKPVVEDALSSAASVLEQRANAEATYRSRLVVPSGPASVEAAAVRHLATRGRPIPSELLHSELTRQGHEISLASLRAFLRAHPAFVGQRGQGYQLGELSERARREEPEDITTTARDVH